MTAAAAQNEEILDLLDFANLKVFGNASFRHRQRAVIETVLQVSARHLVDRQ